MVLCSGQEPPRPALGVAACALHGRAILNTPTRFTWRSLVPDALLPREALTEAHRALPLFWADGVLFGVSNGVVQTFMPLFVLAFGASAADLGLMSAVSHSLAPFTFLFGAYLAERTLHRKRLYLLTEGLFGRGMVLTYMLVPLLLRGRAAVWALIGLVLVRWTFYRLGNPANMVIIGQIVPTSLRGRFMSSRSLGASLGQLAIQPLGSLLVAYLLFPRGYQCAFLLALAAGLVGTYAFARMPVPPPQVEARPAGPSLRGLAREALTDRRFLAFLVVTAIWTFGDQITFAFYSAHMVRNLGLEASVVGLLAAAASLASLVGLPLLGRLSDQYGHRLALVVAGLTLALVRLLWLWVRTPWGLLPLHLLTGLTYSSFQVILLNLLLAIAHPERYARYSALHNAVATAMAVVGPLLGGYLFEHVGFSSDLLLGAVVGVVSMAITWRYVNDRPVPPERLATAIDGA